MEIGVHAIEEIIGQPPVVVVHVYHHGRRSPPMEMRIPIGTVQSAEEVPRKYDPPTQKECK
jgi:hypothetical protein